MKLFYDLQCFLCRGYTVNVWREARHSHAAIVHTPQIQLAACWIIHNIMTCIPWPMKHYHLTKFRGFKNLPIQKIMNLPIIIIIKECGVIGKGVCDLFSFST